MTDRPAFLTLPGWREDWYECPILFEPTWAQVDAASARARAAENQAWHAANSYRAGRVDIDVWAAYEEVRLEARRVEILVRRAAEKIRYSGKRWWEDADAKRSVMTAFNSSQRAVELSEQAASRADRKRWRDCRESTGPTEFTLGVLSLATILFPRTSRMRWVEEWRGELATKGLCGRLRFTLSTLLGIPSMTATVQASRLRRQ